VFALCASVASAAEPTQSFQWQTADPQSQGMAKSRLDAIRDDLEKHATKIFLVVRNDRVVYEWYASDFSAAKPHYTASLAKGMIAGNSLVLAMQDGKIRPTDLASKYVPQWASDPRKSRITVAQLATHTSGLDDANDKAHDLTKHEQLPGWMGAFWRQDPDPFTLSRDQCPVIYEPGERVSYSNPGIAMLTYCVTAAIKDGPHKDVRSLLRDRLFRPIGIGDKEWSCGYGKTYDIDGLKLVGSWGGAAFTASAAARVGRLLLHDGNWDGNQLLDARIVQECTHYPGPVPHNQWEGTGSPRPGFGWWNNLDKGWNGVPRDAFCGAGAGQQYLFVVPSLNLVVVRNGGNMEKTGGNWASAVQHLFRPVVEAIVQEKAVADQPPPCPPSPVIRSITFAPVDSITRKAIDSDNWPITWGDDDNLYTSYGDGRGFEPIKGPKLSMGVARVEGTPPNDKGFNIPSPTAERKGDGPKGPKASGMLMVNGRLYMWVRNAANSTLAWSDDHAKTWTWADWKFEKSFGCPTFLNFGKNYAGARDEYVYTYSQDGPTAYEPYDGIVLARVPKDRITDRASYEFFSATDLLGNPTWRKDLKEKVHVFHYPSHCERLDAVYNPGIKRYLLTVSYGHGKGWGIFDAPAPWGPWTTAFHTTDWGLGRTHDYRLPTKWISPDGTDLYLVFSGVKLPHITYDAFCVRHAKIELTSTPTP